MVVAADKVYEMVADKPPKSSAVYRIRDFINDPEVDITEEARNCASLPGLKASVEFDWSGEPSLVISNGKESVRVYGDARWLVVRGRGPHPLDQQAIVMRDISGSLMLYTDAEFRERYEIGEH